uniref:S2 protein n=1 Tax=Equine infectious anemia virus TaxID=11665 RepID=A0A6B9PS77_9RETR|nr:S2 protein [Equine infectious anemia virus]
MGLFGKGVTWSASRSMGEYRGESQHLLPSSQKKLVQRVRITSYINPIVIIKIIKEQWQKEENQDTKKI